MRLSPDLNSFFCEQAKHELNNVTIYKSVTSFFEDLRLTNIAEKFRKQAAEEYEHYTKVIDYINDRVGGKYIPVDSELPTVIITSPQQAAQLYLDTEIGTTESLEAIADIIEESKSYIDRPFINEMLFIQIEEEKGADEFLQKVSMVKDFVLFDATLKD